MENVYEKIKKLFFYKKVFSNLKKSIKHLIWKESQWISDMYNISLTLIK